MIVEGKYAGNRTFNAKFRLVSKSRACHTSKKLICLSMGRYYLFSGNLPLKDGKIGNGTFLQNISFSTLKHNKNNLYKRNYALTTTKLGFLSRSLVLSNRGATHMSIDREGPTRSSLAKHSLECMC